MLAGEMPYSELLLIITFINIFTEECRAFMYAPSFVSDWYEATAQNESLSLLTIDHNLGEYPVKVDVQVKINEGGKDYIFTGLGSSQRDDDIYQDFGGVIYIYNDQHIKLTFPYYGNSPSKGGLAYTGSNGLYYGPTNLLGPYNTGYVRTRVWLASDMPQIVLNTSALMDNIDNYKEINHGLGYYLDIVTVQTMLSNGYLSDGIGAVFLANTSSSWNRISGVLYGYDDTRIRLWVPSNFSSYSAGGVFEASDGYRLGQHRSGTVNVLGWNIDCKQQVFYRTLTVGHSLIHEDTVTFPCIYDDKYYFVSVQYKIPIGDTPNGGMIFNGVGTTQATDLFNYGGIVYAYTESEVLIWRPNNTVVVYIGDRWGGSQSSQISNTADVIIRVFNLHPTECPYPEAIANGVFHVTGQVSGDNVTYTCNSGYQHSSGNLTRICIRNGTWSGLIPSCVVACQLSHTYTTEDIEGILQKLRVDKKATSSYRRSLTSAHDDRRSVITIGGCGVCILLAVMCFFILPDLISLVRHICWFESIYGK